MTAVLPLEDHPLRQALNEELTIRRFPAFPAPATLLQIVMVTGEGGFEADRAAGDALCAKYGVACPPGKHFVARLDRTRLDGVRLDGMLFVWERHTEFVSYTIIQPGKTDPTFKTKVLDSLPADWVASIPGQVMRATEVAMLGPDDPEPSAELLDAAFPGGNLVSWTVSQGAARVWSQFRVHEDGFGRLLIHNRALLPADLSRLVQQIQELGNYRNMALIGLPEAQRLSPELSGLQQRLGTLSESLISASVDDTVLLEELLELSAELSRMMARTSYRMSATKAYAELAADRLRSIGGERIQGFPTLADFTERRLIPAVRTCESFTARLEDLSQRTSWASSLLRTRVETVLERQSRDLLHAMDRRLQVQVGLQQTVEGLSVVAVSYYAIGLISYLSKALTVVWPGLDPAVFTAFCVPVVVPLVWLILHRLISQLMSQHKKPAKVEAPPA